MNEQASASAVGSLDDGEHARPLGASIRDRVPLGTRTSGACAACAARAQVVRGWWKKEHCEKKASRYR
jgi:hypothetical protein